MGQQAGRANWMDFPEMLRFYEQVQAAGTGLEPDADFLADPALGRYVGFQLRKLELPEGVCAFLTQVGLPDCFADYRSPEEERERFQRAMEAKFCGPTNTSRVLIVWGENGAVKPEIEPFTGSANADSYNAIEGIVFQKIISAHRLASPTLAGVSGSGNLSGNASEIVDAFILFNYTVIEQMRRRILDRLNVFTRINGVAPLVVEELEVVTKIRESENAEQTIMTPQNSRGGENLTSQRARASHRASASEARRR